MPDNTIQTILAVATQRLTRAGCDTARLDAEILLAHTLKKDRVWLYTYPQKIPKKEQLSQFDDLLQRREQREPVAYLTGHREFYGLDFQVNSHVLIPRPETELLIETALALAANFSAPITIADIGTGSGCIAVTLAKNIVDATLFAVDVSAQALQLAQQNAKQHTVESRINFLQGNLLTPITQPVDMIVSNPPYVSGSELDAVMPEVSHYEPALALDGGPDGLDIVRDLLPQAKAKLNPGGCLLVEIGAGQGVDVKNLAKDCFPTAKIEIKKDLAGLDRLLVVDGANV